MAIELLLDGLWKLVEPFIPVAKAKPKGGRPRFVRQGMSHWHCIHSCAVEPLGRCCRRRWAVALE
jgi:hypothetical protein